MAAVKIHGTRLKVSKVNFIIINICESTYSVHIYYSYSDTTRLKSRVNSSLITLSPKLLKNDLDP